MVRLPWDISSSLAPLTTFPKKKNQAILHFLVLVKVKWADKSCTLFSSVVLTPFNGENT